MRALGHSGTMWTPQGSLAIGDDVEIDDAKALVRAEIRAHRRSRSSKLALDAGKAIAAHVKELLDGVEIVAAFASQPSEPDMTPILSALHEAGCEIRLPQLGPGLTRAWARYTPGDPLTEQAPGRPPAPLGPSLPEESLAEADLVLAPALAVDTRGNRLGQGGGWYDRALQHKRPTTPVYAVIFADEFTESELPTAEHDQRIDGVITPEAFVRLGTVKE